jgi:hypothetical protein
LLPALSRHRSGATAKTATVGSAGAVVNVAFDQMLLPFQDSSVQRCLRNYTTAFERSGAPKLSSNRLQPLCNCRFVDHVENISTIAESAGTKIIANVS